MKTLIIVGSPRKGTSLSLAQCCKNYCLDAEIIELRKFNIKPCLGCDCCKKNEDHSCIQKDDLSLIISKLKNADTVVFISPIYWWGVTATMKCFIDRLYSFDSWKGKEFKLILNGGAETSDIEYKLIHDLFKEMMDYLNVPFTGFATFEAYQDKILEINNEVEEKIKALFLK